MADLHYADEIVKEVIARRDILLDLNDLRNPEANKKKQKAWKEVQDAILIKCRKLLSIDQIKRVWRHKKSNVKGVLMSEKRYRAATGGGIDTAIELAIAKNSANLSEADLAIARSLGKEAVFRGLGNKETFVNEEGPSKCFETRHSSPSTSSSSSLLSSNTPQFVDPAEVKEIRLRRVREQLDTFPSDSDDDDSIRCKRKRRTFTDKEVNTLQMELLKEERALIAKKSILLDKQIAFYEAALAKLTQGTQNVGASDATSLEWAPHDGDPHLAMSHRSK